MKRTITNLLVVCLILSHFTSSLRIGVDNQNVLQVNAIAKNKGKSEVLSKTQIVSATSSTSALISKTKSQAETISKAIAEARTRGKLVMEKVSKGKAKVAMKSTVKAKAQAKTYTNLNTNTIASLEKNYGLSEIKANAIKAKKTKAEAKANAASKSESATASKAANESLSQTSLKTALKTASEALKKALSRSVALSKSAKAAVDSLSASKTKAEAKAGAKAGAKAIAKLSSSAELNTSLAQLQVSSETKTNTKTPFDDLMAIILSYNELYETLTITLNLRQEMRFRFVLNNQQCIQARLDELQIEAMVAEDSMGLQIFTSEDGTFMTTVFADVLQYCLDEGDIIRNDYLVLEVLTLSLEREYGAAFQLMQQSIEAFLTLLTSGLDALMQELVGMEWTLTNSENLLATQDAAYALLIEEYNVLVTDLDNCTTLVAIRSYISMIEDCTWRIGVAQERVNAAIQYYLDAVSAVEAKIAEIETYDLSEIEIFQTLLDQARILDSVVRADQILHYSLTMAQLIVLAEFDQSRCMNGFSPVYNLAGNQPFAGEDPLLKTQTFGTDDLGIYFNSCVDFYIKAHGEFYFPQVGFSSNRLIDYVETNTTSAGNGVGEIAIFVDDGQGIATVCHEGEFQFVWLEFAEVTTKVTACLTNGLVTFSVNDVDIGFVAIIPTTNVWPIATVDKDSLIDVVYNNSLCLL